MNLIYKMTIDTIDSYFLYCMINFIILIMKIIQT